MNTDCCPDGTRGSAALRVMYGAWSFDLFEFGDVKVSSVRMVGVGVTGSDRDDVCAKGSSVERSERA